MFFGNSIKLTDLKTYEEIGLKEIIGVIFPLRPGHFGIRFLKCLNTNNNLQRKISLIHWTDFIFDLISRHFIAILQYEGNAINRKTVFKKKKKKIY